MTADGETLLLAELHVILLRRLGVYPGSMVFFLELMELRNHIARHGPPPV